MAPHGKELSQDLKDVIIKLYKEEKSQCEIAKIINKSSSTVQKIIEKYKKEGNTNNKTRSGRPKIFNDREKRIITRKIEANPKMSAPKVMAEIEKETGKTCNPQTIRRVLYASGYHGRNIRKKPFVSSTNRRKRLDFVGEYESKDENFWKSVIFSDESKYNIFGSDGCQKVWRKVNTEHLWDYLEKQIRRHNITSKDTLKAALLEEWNKIPPTVTQNLISSMPSRLKSVKKAKGYPTKY